jgi:hypothetical protein
MKKKPLLKVKVKGFKGAKARKFNAILAKEFNSAACIHKFILAHRDFIFWGKLEPNPPKTP